MGQKYEHISKFVTQDCNYIIDHLDIGWMDSRLCSSQKLCKCCCTTISVIEPPSYLVFCIMCIAQLIECIFICTTQPISMSINVFLGCVSVQTIYIHMYPCVSMKDTYWIQVCPFIWMNPFKLTILALVFHTWVWPFTLYASDVPWLD